MKTTNFWDLPVDTETCANCSKSKLIVTNVYESRVEEFGFYICGECVGLLHIKQAEARQKNLATAKKVLDLFKAGV